ncbi:cytidylate kinase family protein [Candidatus Uhrbacteria bacterium]|nr:cytidylate kinase family protein [Candidatus Uhrbacteria bacterium]
MIITLTGRPGSGKSTIAKRLSENLGIPWYSMGDLRGKMAHERGMTIDEFNTLGETQDFTDTEVDDYQTKLGQEQQDVIMDGRLSWHFIPNSFKIFLDVDEDEAAQRIFDASKKGLRKDERPYASAEEVKERVRARVASDQSRYQKYYGLDYLNQANYDLVIDTTHLSPEQIITQILDKIPTVS